MFHRLRLAPVRNHDNDFPGAQDLSHRHRNCLRGHIRHTSEPSLVHLLLPASLVELDYEIRIVDFEIGGRIVECQVRILPNSDKGQIDRLVLKFSPDFSDRASSISVAVQKVVSGDSRLIDQALEQILPKTRRVRDRKSDVFVKVENFDTTPIDVRSSSERIKEFELRCARSRDNSSDATLAYGSPNRSRGLIRRG